MPSLSLCVCVFVSSHARSTSGEFWISGTDSNSVLPPTHPPTRHLLPVVAASLLREIGYKYIFLQRSLGGGVGGREMIPPPDSREEGFWVEKLGVCSNRRSVGHADSRRPLRISTLFFLSNLSPFLPSIFLSRLVSSLLFRTSASSYDNSVSIDHRICLWWGGESSASRRKSVNRG